MKAVFVFFILFFSSLPIYALNPIHDASYQLVHRIIGNKDGFVSVGTLFNPRAPGDLHIPVSGGLIFGPDVEIGLGIKTQWIEVGDKILHGVVGVRYRIKRNLILNADILVPLTSGHETGLSFGFQKQSWYHKRFFTYFTGRLGFLDALADDALAAFEIAYYPTIKIFSPIYLEMGIIGSSQTNQFEEHLAIDLQPGVRVPIGRSNLLHTSCSYGLAGDRKEEARFNVIIIKRL